jgi:hypothetical protein
MNALIVESGNDKDFVEALIRDIELESIEVDAPNCEIDEFACMGGLNLSKLREHLREKIDEIKKGNIRRLGILIDQDKETKAGRLSFVSQAASDAFEQTIVLEDTNTFYTIQLDKDTDFELVCHFTNVDGEGELETVLKAIATEESVYADCLEAWKTCIEAKGKKISKKEFDKFWISNYIRFDTCTSKQKKQAERKCSMKNFDYVLANKAIFDLKATELTDLRAFLSLFKK